MTETRAEYKTETENNNTAHRCSNCQKVYGFETDEGFLVSDGAWLKDFEIFRAKCGYCGAQIKWYSTDYRMQRLIKGRKK
jgi:hypothetical protein